MFKFNENSDLPRRKQFWNKLSNYLPASYATTMAITTTLYQVGLTSDHTIARVSLITLYVQSGIIVLAAVGTTAARNFRTDFDTWWTENPQYQQINQYPSSFGFSEEEQRPMI